ncbi:sensor histidine kinase [Mangrovibacterium lignilyticum]|uniref:sensor histidine kinase n=1 Tax=Mangrovibacterium lignilyticum TaxID=2668052 RepID=UPI0013D0F0B6|nr:histidine kinase [Mangrovibacterium lignilyticum]
MGIIKLHQWPTKGIPMLKTGQHLFFWIISYLFFVLFFGRANRDYQSTVAFSAMLFPLAIATSYFLNYYLIPKFLYRAAYFRFILLLVYTLIFTLWFEVLISLFVFTIVSDFKLYKIDPSTFDIVFLLVGLYFVILAFIAIEQVKRAFEMKKENTRLMNQQLETELKLRESELKLLRAQIHPHFLFNTLNNLYGLTLEKSDLAPELVLKLSDLMDYMLYKCNKPLVQLSSEVEHLKNYIEIERIRYAQKIKIDFQVKGEAGNTEIAPMLLLAFFENAFKHGVSKSIVNPFVTIQLNIDEAVLHLNMVNSCNPASEKDDDYSRGIGLKNVRKRLELLYPNHNLQIENKADTFEVDLRIPLNVLPTENKVT